MQILEYIKIRESPITFAAKDRAQTMQTLVEWASADDPNTAEVEEAAHGGREYAGYQKVFLDHLENTGSIAQAELAQQVELQRKEWDARAEELQYQQASWESKMQTVVVRGKKQWFAAENAFLARWNSEKSEEDARIREAEKQWDSRIAKHQTEKLAWQQDMQTRLAEKVLEEDLGKAIDDLNAQILNNRNQMKADLPLIDRSAALNEAKDKLRRQSLDSSRLANVNRSIDDFNTNVKLQLQSRALGAGDIYDVMKDFEDNMESHKKNMQVKAKVQILEQYRDLVAKFVQSIEQQNDSYENQTRTAALSSGFVQFGDRFIKKGQGSTNIGVVDAITRFNIQSEADQFRATSQIFASEEQFTRLMRNASMPEFEAILHVEKLKVQHWMTSISGTATDSATRSRTTDPNKLGKFGAWMGRAPDSHTSQGFQHFAGGDLLQNLGGAGISVAAQSMSGGMGQLGASPARPGSIATPGFYIQLSFWNQTVAQRNSAILTEIAQDGQQVIQTVGSALMLTGVPVAVTAGIAMTALSSSTQIDPTTGEVSYKMTEQALVQTAISAAGAALAPGAGEAVGEVASQTTGEMLASFASNNSGALLSAAAAPIQYDARGRITGYSIGSVTTADAAGFVISAAAQATSSWLSGEIMNSTLLGDSLAGKFGGAIVAQGVSHTINRHTALLNRSIGSNNQVMHSWGSIAGGIAYNEYRRWEHEQKVREFKEVEQIARKAQEDGNTRQAAEILMGLGYTKEDTDQLLESFNRDKEHRRLKSDGKTRDAVAKDLAYKVLGVAVSDGKWLSNSKKYSEAEKLIESALADKGYVTEEELQQIGEQVTKKPGYKFNWADANRGAALLQRIDIHRFSTDNPAGVLPANTTLTIDGKLVKTDGTGRVVPVFVSDRLLNNHNQLSYPASNNEKEVPFIYHSGFRADASVALFEVSYQTGRYFIGDTGNLDDFYKKVISNLQTQDGTYEIITTPAISPPLSMADIPSNIGKILRGEIQYEFGFTYGTDNPDILETDGSASVTYYDIDFGFGGVNFAFGYSNQEQKKQGDMDIFGIGAGIGPGTYGFSITNSAFQSTVYEKNPNQRRSTTKWPWEWFK